MRVVVTHSNFFDYETEFYAPLKASKAFGQHTFYLPYAAPESLDRKEEIRRANLIVSEVSHLSALQAIEIGWADAFSIPHLMLAPDGAELLPQIRSLQGDLWRYLNPSGITDAVTDYIENMLSGGRTPQSVTQVKLYRGVSSNQEAEELKALSIRFMEAWGTISGMAQKVSARKMDSDSARALLEDGLEFLEWGGVMLEMFIPDQENAL